MHYNTEYGGKRQRFQLCDQFLTTAVFEHENRVRFAYHTLCPVSYDVVERMRDVKVLPEDFHVLNKVNLGIRTVEMPLDCRFVSIRRRDDRSDGKLGTIKKGCGLGRSLHIPRMLAPREVFLVGAPGDYA